MEHLTPLWVLLVARERVVGRALAVTEGDEGHNVGLAVLAKSLDHLIALVGLPVLGLAPLAERAQDVEAGNLLLRVGGQMCPVVDPAEAGLLVGGEDRVAGLSSGGDGQDGGGRHQGYRGSD
jgi:hypothetical protein